MGALSYLNKILTTIGKNGRGWFYAPESKRIVGIAESALGPHGDHDGWIRLASNARDLGIEPSTAKMIQRGSYGFPLSQQMTRDMKSAGVEPSFEQNGRAIYMPAFGDSYPPADELFEKLYGTPPDPGTMGEAISQLPISRLRAWPSRGGNSTDIFSVTNNPITPNELRSIWDLIGNEMSPTPATQFLMDTLDGGQKRMPLMDALNAKKFSRGGLSVLK